MTSGVRHAARARCRGTPQPAPHGNPRRAGYNR